MEKGTFNFIIDDTIEDVDASAKALIRKKYRGIITFLVVIGSLWQAAILYQTFRDAAFAQDHDILFPLAIPFFVYWGGYLLIRRQIKQQFMRQFAAANGLAYHERGKIKDLEGSLFQIGHSKKLEDVIQGETGGFPFRLYTYVYTVGHGKGSQTHHFTVFEFRFDAALPHILLTADNLRYGTLLSSSFGNAKRVKLESIYENTFSLYCQEGYEIEALQIFDHDMLTFLVTAGANYSVDLCGNKLFMYDDRIITTKKELTEMFQLGQELVTRSGAFLNRMKDDFEALHPYYQKK